MDLTAAIRDVATRLKLLEPDGDSLAAIDSLKMVAFVVALEEATGRVFPLEEIEDDSFTSVGSLAALMTRHPG